MAREQGRESGASDADAERDAPESGSAFNALPDFVRKAFATGLSGFFLTEEALRKALGDTLPKDWADFAIDQSSRARDDFLERLSLEVGRALENVDLAAVLSQLLEGRTLEVKAEVRLSPRQGAEAPLRLEVASGEVKVRDRVEEGDEGG
jgi:hypothetical protein